MSVPLLLLESSVPPGSKALAALVDAHGGELTMLNAEIDIKLGGSGSAKATQRKLAPLVSGGWASVGLERGHRTIRLLWTVGDHTVRKPSGVVDENRPVAVRGMGCSVRIPNSSELLTHLREHLEHVQDETAADFIARIVRILDDLGLAAQRETLVASRGTEDGYRGHVDLAVPCSDRWVAFELDRKSPRFKSVVKLAQLEAVKVVILREPGFAGVCPPLLDGVLVVEPGANRWLTSDSVPAAGTDAVALIRRGSSKADSSINRGPELPPEQASEDGQLALVDDMEPSKPARSKGRRRTPKAWPPATDAERLFLEHCVASLNKARLRAGWKAKRVTAESEPQCTRPLAWYRERIEGERRHRVEADASDMIQAVVWAHRRAPGCDGTQTDLVRIWKGTQDGRLRVIQWLDEWIERDRPDPAVPCEPVHRAQSGGVHIEDDEVGKW